MENNKLIADFMGIQYIEEEELISTLRELRKSGQDHLIKLNKKEIESLNYHEDWNLLVPVVHEIAKRGFEFVWTRNAFHIYYTDHSGNTQNGLKYMNNYVSGDIEMIYNTVVEFINWYNKK